jgi:ubiquinone/menaquinone biosynthesis C-methylase UbiE
VWRPYERPAPGSETAPKLDAVAFGTLRHLKAALAAAPRFVPTGAPDRQRSLERYHAIAESYDRRTLGGDYFRGQAVARLAPAPGAVIIDVGCGTGRNFAAILKAIGPDGRLIGVELCQSMLDVARTRIERHGWTNVELLHADAGHAEIPAIGDAALLCAVHDVMRSPAALANVLRHLRAGARIVAAGPKFVPWRGIDALSMNLGTWWMNRACVTTFEGFAEPWSHLERLVDNLVVDEVFQGGGYVASGIRPLTLKA